MVGGSCGDNISIVEGNIGDGVPFVYEDKTQRDSVERKEGSPW